MDLVPPKTSIDDAMLAKLADVFREVFANESLSVSPGTTASDIKGWDSLAHIRLMLSVQRAFRLRLSAAETSQLSNVGALLELLRRKQERS